MRIRVITRFRSLGQIRVHNLHYDYGALLLQGYAVWVKECRGDLLETRDQNVSGRNWQVDGGLRERHVGKKQEGY